MSSKVAISDGIRREMTGIHIEMEGGVFRFAATDGRIVACGECTGVDGDEGTDLPKNLCELIEQVNGYDTAVITGDKGRCMLCLGYYTINARTIEDKFPRYKALLRSPNYTISTGAALWCSACPGRNLN